MTLTLAEELRCPPPTSLSSQRPMASAVFHDPRTRPVRSRYSHGPVLGRAMRLISGRGRRTIVERAMRCVMTLAASVDWSTLPAPVDDGGANHLPGVRLPSVALHATNGTCINLALLKGKTVVYAYPRTGEPGVPVPPEWDMIPGARGCTPQSCAFRDHFADLKALGVDHLFGLSTQDTAYQREAATRLHLPFPLLSDANLELTSAMRFPTFKTSGMTLLKRLTLIIENGMVRYVFYPVFPPDESADRVVAWLSRG